MDPVRKSDRTGLLFIRDRSGTGTERIQTDPKLDLQNSSYGSVWIRSGPVPLGSVPKGSMKTEVDPPRSRANIAKVFTESNDFHKS